MAVVVAKKQLSNGSKMPNIQAVNAQVFSVDGVPKQRGRYEVVVDGELVGIRLIGRNSYIKGCELQRFSNYNGLPSVNDVINFLKQTIFL